MVRVRRTKVLVEQAPRSNAKQQSHSRATFCVHVLELIHQLKTSCSLFGYFHCRLQFHLVFLLLSVHLLTVCWLSSSLTHHRLSLWASVPLHSVVALEGPSYGHSLASGISCFGVVNEIIGEMCFQETENQSFGWGTVLVTRRQTSLRERAKTAKYACIPVRVLK